MDIITILGVIGLIVISISIWIKNEQKQDVYFIIGGLFLFIYSVGIHNLIFSVLQIVFMLSALVEIMKKSR